MLLVCLKFENPFEIRDFPLLYEVYSVQKEALMKKHQEWEFLTLNENILTLSMQCQMIKSLLKVTMEGYILVYSLPVPTLIHFTSITVVKFEGFECEDIELKSLMLR